MLFQPFKKLPKEIVTFLLKSNTSIVKQWWIRMLHDVYKKMINISLIKLKSSVLSNPLSET
jgi:hypothetical protein